MHFPKPGTTKTMEEGKKKRKRGKKTGDVTYPADANGSISVTPVLRIREIQSGKLR
jgi:hypothetical protein